MLKRGDLNLSVVQRSLWWSQLVERGPFLRRRRPLKWEVRVRAAPELNRNSTESPGSAPSVDDAT